MHTFAEFPEMSKRGLCVRRSPLPLESTFSRSICSSCRASLLGMPDATAGWTGSAMLARCLLRRGREHGHGARRGRG